jgi:hypothetical protein
MVLVFALSIPLWSAKTINTLQPLDLRRRDNSGYYSFHWHESSKITRLLPWTWLRVALVMGLYH